MSLESMEIALGMCCARTVGKSKMLTEPLLEEISEISSEISVVLNTYAHVQLNVGPWLSTENCSHGYSQEILDMSSSSMSKSSHGYP
jgi:hypothetical protein